MRTREPPRVSNVARTRSVVTSTFCDTGTAAVAAGSTAATAADDAAPATGTLAVLACAGAVTTGGGANMDGCPLCLLQPSHSITSETENTPHSTARRVSVIPVIQVSFERKKTVDATGQEPDHARPRTRDGSGRCARSSARRRAARRVAPTPPVHRPNTSARSDRTSQAMDSATGDSRAPVQSSPAEARRSNGGAVPQDRAWGRS